MDSPAEGGGEFVGVVVGEVGAVPAEVAAEPAVVVGAGALWLEDGVLVES